MKLRTGGQKKLEKFLQFCFEQGWTKEQVAILQKIWIAMRDEYGNLKAKWR